MRLFFSVCLLFWAVTFISAQDSDPVFRGSVPVELLRPRRGEIAHYPVDTVIGKLGQGSASDEAYAFANSVASRLLAENVNHPVFSSIDGELLDSYLSALLIIEPRSYRLGGGKEEPDDAVSFLIRFIGKDQGITGELFIRFISDQKTEIAVDEDGEEVEVITPVNGKWVFEELILEEAKDHGHEIRESLHRYDFSPYERFF